MALKAQDGIVRAHSTAIVNDLNKRSSGIQNDYLNVRSPCIHRILHQLLHHGSRPLHHLPRSNHVCNILW